MHSYKIQIFKVVNYQSYSFLVLKNVLFIKILFLIKIYKIYEQNVVISDANERYMEITMLQNSTKRNLNVYTITESFRALS